MHRDKANTFSMELLARTILGIQGSLSRNMPRAVIAKSRLLSRRIGYAHTVLRMNEEKNTPAAGHVLGPAEV